MARLREAYYKDIVPFLMKEFAYKSSMQVPRLKKIVVNVGLGEMTQQKELVESVREELALLTGQRPALRTAKKAISNFKIRIGVPVGYVTTLRGARMYEFLDRLVNFVIPRIRDFRGVPTTSFDQQGNYTLGIKEQTIFPELDLDKIPIVHGLDICLVTTAKTKEESMKLLEGFGMPFAKK